MFFLFDVYETFIAACNSCVNIYDSSLYTTANYKIWGNYYSYACILLFTKGPVLSWTILYIYSLANIYKNSAGILVFYTTVLPVSSILLLTTFCPATSTIAFLISCYRRLFGFCLWPSAFFWYFGIEDDSIYIFHSNIYNGHVYAML